MTLRPTLSSSTKVTLTASFSVVVIFAVHQSSCMCQKKLKNLFTSLYQCNPWWKSVLMTDRPLLWEDQPLWNCSFYTCLQLTPYRPTADSIIHAYSWFHHTCLQVTPSYMPTADSIIHAYSWFHHTCLQLTPSYMPTADSIIHACKWILDRSTQGFQCSVYRSVCFLHCWVLHIPIQGFCGAFHLVWSQGFIFKWD